MSQQTLAEILGDFAYNLSFQDLSHELVEKAQISIADGIGCALAGLDLPSSKIARGLWDKLKREGKSTVWVTGERADSESTAWVNCLLMHSLLHDDQQECTVGHMGSFIIPTAFAVTEEEGKGGKDFLTAVVAAYEVATRIAMKSGLKIVKRGFRGSPIFGPFAAATAAGKIMHLTRDQMQNAIACAASFSCGLLEAVKVGSMEWRFQNGAALKNGLMAAALAKEGLLAAKTALEGELGFFAAFGGPELREEILGRQEEVTKTLGRDFEVGKNAFKPFPTCGYNQVGVEVAMAMAKQHDIRPENVEKIHVSVSPENKNYPGGDFHGPFATIDQALLSKPFSIAAAIIFKNISVNTYLSKLNSPEIRGLAEKVTTEGKEGMGFLDYKIEMRLKNGKIITGDHTLADMKNYSLDKNREVEKFCRLSSNLLEKDDATKIVRAIFQLQDMPNLTEISEMLKNGLAHGSRSFQGLEKRVRKLVSLEKLFQPGAIGSLKITNRIIMSPMITHYTREGAVTDRLIAYYAERAIGGTGLIVLEASYPRTGGHPGRVHIWNDTFVPGLRRLTEEIHSCGGKIAIQINPSRGRGDEADPISASNIPHPVTGVVPRALNLAEIKKLEEDFGRSVIRAREAGFDALMIHGGSGYLISEFLSPRINLRKDAYGGNIQGRARLAIEMVLEAKKQGGKDFPVILRLAASERLEGGISLEDIFETCRLAMEVGLDAIDVVSGVAETMEWQAPSMYFPLACNVPLAEEIKKKIPLPISVAGRINDPFLAEEILEKGKADFIVMGRPLLADPLFPVKAREGRVAEIRKCIGCLRCIESFIAHSPLVCAVNPELGREGESGQLRGKRKKVFVIGGGPAGLQAAVTAAERGHEVVLIEKEKKLGGQINLAAVPPGKGDLSHLVDYLLKQLEKQKDSVKIVYEEGNLDSIRGLNPDVVIAAMGSVPFIPDILGINEGIKRKKVITGRDVLSEKVKLGRKSVVIGGGMIGCEIAEYLVEKGQEVVILEVLPDLAMDAFSWIRKIILQRLEKRGIKAFTGVKEEQIIEEGIEIVDHSGKRVLIEADKIILATGLNT